MALLKLVFNPGDLDGYGGTLFVEACGTVFQRGDLSFQLAVEQGKLGIPVVQLLAVGCIRFQQVLDTVALTPGRGDLFLRGGYLLPDVGTLAGEGLPAGLQLEFLQMKLDRIDQSDFGSPGKAGSFFCIQEKQTAGSFGRNNDFGSFKGARSIKFRTGTASGEAKQC